MSELTQSKAWQDLKAHAQKMQNVQMRDLFAKDSERFSKLSLQLDDLLFDYSKNRITDETAPLKALVPDHPLLTTPNRIGPADWEGWVQERGTYFLEARDPRYVELLSGADPFENNPGEKKGILVEAPVGQGTWTYVGLVLFRQVPAGVPGGWRLLANLVSRPRGVQ